MADTELPQLIVYVGTTQQIADAIAAGTITENDFAISTDAPEYQTLLTSANAGAGIAITNENGVVKITNTREDATWGYINGDIANQYDLQQALAGKQNVIVDLDTIRSGAALGATSLQASDIVNNTSTTATNKALSANMGKSLQDQVDNLKARGRFLALWNCATGLAETNPPESPYTYKAGDYFVIGTIASGSGTNYKPNGSSYTIGVASTTVETAEVAIDDCYFYDGTNWKLQSNAQKTLSFANIAGDPYDNTNLASALNAKQDELVQGTGIAIDSTTNTISNSGVRSVSTGGTNGTISVNTNGTSADVAVKGLGSAAYTSTTDYATSAQGGKADTAIQGVQINSTDLSKDVNNKVNIPKASTSDLGVSKINTIYGIGITSNGELRTYAATSAEIESKSNTAKPIVPNTIEKSVMEGLGNYSGTAWTDAYKANARATIGAGTAQNTIFRDYE